MASSIVASLSSALSDFAAVPWLEEALIIAMIGVAFILTHMFGVASVQRPAKGRKLAALKEVEELEEEEEYLCDDRARARPTRRAREPERRVETGVSCPPRTSKELPGVTDRRFAGRIVSYKEEEGYGFISCPELYPRFRRDIFLHKLQIRSFGVGAPVSFGVFLNKNGQPQAKDLMTPAPLPMPDSSMWEGWNPVAHPFEPVTRQPLNPHAKPFLTGAAVVDTDSQLRRPLSKWAEWGEAAQDSKVSCERQRTPKIPQGKLQWVPKKAAAGAEQ